MQPSNQNEQKNSFLVNESHVHIKLYENNLPRAFKV